MISAISVQEALSSKSITLVDVRAPIEFKEDHIPGAINIPLLNDEERHLVGCTYKSKGAVEAKKLGLELIAPQLNSKIQSIIKLLKDDKKLTLYCFRGGLRSNAFATFLDLIDVPVQTISGGYKSYRQLVHSQVHELYPFKLVVLYGYTGCGKTEILKILEEKGAPMIDLEELAGHRGSAFGHIGMTPVRSQKYFETLLYSKIKQFSHQPYVFIEGESRGLGSITLPNTLMMAMKNGEKIWIETPIQYRVQRIYDQYFRSSLEAFDPDIFLQPLMIIQKKLGSQLYENLKNSLAQKDYKTFISQLLLGYYDKCYFSKSFTDKDFRLSTSVQEPLYAAHSILENFSS
ncbi:MAG: tRNA 2-selenouridine(34) synthase MnmH [Deltaproteobacteria bacterium]|nr:tRNA 2-selenouridine(34) synthase MnmH [Deltaproteobacteria bacterium]